MNAIEAVSLSKIYHRSRTQALSDITLTIGGGEIFTLLGRNGAGKTTFLRIAATQLMPTKGRISVLGHDARDEPLEISSLSGGLRQRVRVAMAVATDADLIFLDEPTLGLDAVSRRQIWGVLNEIQKEGRSILLTTHYIDEAEILSNNVTIIDHGKMVLSGSPAELLRNVKERVRVDIVGSAFSEEELNGYGRVVRLAERFRVLTDDQRGRELADEGMKRGSDVALARVSLEDLFVDLVGRAEE